MNNGRKLEWMTLVLVQQQNESIV